MRPEIPSPQGNQETHISTEFENISAFLFKSYVLPKGEPTTYGATPLDRMATLSQQHELSIDLQKLTYDIPGDVPLELASYVHSTFAVRFHNRAEANEENYMTSLRTKEMFKDQQLVMGIIERGELGTATVSELLLTRQLLGIRSVELACLTHPYGERIDILPEMREAVREHVELLDGVYDENPETRYRVKEIITYPSETSEVEKAFLMTRKRTLGVMPDGTMIRERSSFVLRLDESSYFSREEVAKFDEVDLTRSDWQDELVRVGRLDEAAALLLENDEFALAIPVSSTIYAFNQETALAVEAQLDELKKQRRAAFAKEHPILSAAMLNSLNNLSENKVIRLKGEMLFVGPEDDE